MNTKFTSFFLDFLIKTICIDPNARWSAQMLENHPFVNKKMVLVQLKDQITNKNCKLNQFDKNELD